MRRFYLLHICIFSKARRNGFEHFFSLFAQQYAFSVFVYMQADFHIIHRVPAHHRRKFLRHPAFHIQRQPCNVRIACMYAQIDQSRLRRFRLVGAPLRTKLSCFFGKVLYKCIPLQQILLLLFAKRHQPVAHQQVFVPLCRNLLPQLLQRHLACRRVRILSCSCVFQPVRDIFCRFIEHCKIFLAQSFISFPKPVDIKRTVLQFFG